MFRFLSPRWLILLAFFPVLAQAATITVSWNAPTICADGSALTNCPVTKYTLYSGLQGQPKTVLGTTLPTVLTFSALNTGPGTWCLQVSASSLMGESGLSNEACKTIAAPVPGVPGGVTLTVSASSTTAYTLGKSTSQIVMSAYGTVPPGSACDSTQGVFVQGLTYYLVLAPVSATGNVKSLTPFAFCGG